MFNLLVILLVFVALFDFFAPRSAVERVRSDLLNYWVFVEELPFSQELGQHVAAVRVFLKRHALKVVFYLAIILATIVAVGFASNLYAYYKDAPSFVKNNLGFVMVNGLVNGHVENKINAAVLAAFPTEFPAETDNDDADIVVAADDEMKSRIINKIQECGKTFANDEGCRKLMDVLVKLKTDHELLLRHIERVQNESSQSFGFKLVLSSLAVDAISGSIYLVSFALSIVVTLLLLRAMERVRLRSTVYCLLDLFLAVVIPVGILTLVVTAFVFTVSQEYDSILDRPGDPEFEYRLAWMAAAVFPYLTVLPVIFSKIFYSNIYGPVEIFFMAWGLFKWALLQLQFFSTDLLTILKGQIGTISLESAQRNWTIGMSVGFSLAYIIAVAFLLLAKRSLIFRTASTRILQHFIEHPRGPIGGFALMLAGVLFVARFYV